MYSDIDGRTLIGPVGDDWDEDKVGRGRNGQELCQPLNHGNDNQMQQAHIKTPARSAVLDPDY